VSRGEAADALAFADLDRSLLEERRSSMPLLAARRFTVRPR